MNISRRGLILGALATPFVVRAASLDFIPRADWDGVYRLINRHLSGMGWMNVPPGTQQVYMSGCTAHLPANTDAVPLVLNMIPECSVGNEIRDCRFWSDA
ncbi:MAG: hypothetical protein AAGJ94_15495 [Pseudomonadota bacterium]